MGKSDSAHDISRYNCSAYFVERRLSSCVSSRSERGREDARRSMVYKSRRIDRDRFVTRYFMKRSSKLIRCKFMKHRFVSPMKGRGWGRGWRTRHGGCFVFSYSRKRMEIVKDVSSARKIDEGVFFSCETIIRFNKHAWYRSETFIKIYVM